mmetsp:Transcript_56575/g.132499  ORF Transcript_56575/g.132499 Transcript_56575/m.132499 type:complete len:442 (-) Transcript_56575:46-1371(-)
MVGRVSMIKNPYSRGVLFIVGVMLISFPPPSTQCNTATVSSQPSPGLRGPGGRLPQREVSDPDLLKDINSGVHHHIELKHAEKQLELKSDQAKDHGWVSEVGEVGEVLGVGSFSVVHAAKNVKTGQPLAVKMVKIPKDNEIFLRRLKREVKILKVLEHPNIVKLVNVFEAPTKVNLVMERCDGGELFNLLEGMEFEEDGTRMWVPPGPNGEQNSFEFSEGLVVDIVYQILAAVRYMHDRNIVHRDLKLENVLLEEPYCAADRVHHVKVVDFGFAKALEPTEELFSACGSPHYAAPEVIRAKDSGVGYRYECDMWAMGIITYTLLCCQYPFDGENDQSIISKVQTGDFSFPAHVTVSAEAQDFVRSLVQVNPQVRLTAAEAVEHPWIKKHVARGSRVIEACGKLSHSGGAKTNQRWTPGGESSYLGVPISSLSTLEDSFGTK